MQHNFNNKSVSGSAPVDMTAELTTAFGSLDAARLRAHLVKEVTHPFGGAEFVQAATRLRVGSMGGQVGVCLCLDPGAPGEIVSGTIEQ